MYDLILAIVKRIETNVILRYSRPQIIIIIIIIIKSMCPVSFVTVFPVIGNKL